MKNFIALLSFATLLPLAANADPSTSSILPLSLKHKASVEVSTGMGTGNIDNQNFRVSGKLVSTKDKYTNEIKAKYSDVDKRNGDSESIYNVGEKLKYSIDDDSYAFGELDYDNNKAIGVKSRTSELAGYGRKLIDKDNFKLTGEAGAGLRQSSYSAGLEDESSYLGKAGTDMDWEVYDGVNLNNNTYMAFTEDNTQTVSDTSLKTFVYDNAYVKGGVEVENNSKVPTGFKKTDTVTSVGVGYEF